jgi:hypothetical protein
VKIEAKMNGQANGNSAGRPPPIMQRRMSVVGSFKSAKRTEVHLSMKMAAKEAKFQDFFQKCRSLLDEIDETVREEEYNYMPEVDEDLLLSLQACKNQRQ